jgi:hypothetical protein
MNSTQPTANLIFDYRFMVRVPDLQTRSEQHIKMFGVHSTGDRAQDMIMANQLITVMISIAEMVEYHKQGVNIRVVKRQDVLTIYDYITRHLQAWKERLNQGLNIGDAPIDDLISLDQFANVVHESAKYQFTREIADSILAKHLASTITFNKHNIFKKESSAAVIISNQDPTKDKVEKEEDLQRDGFAQLFKDKKIGSSRWN